MTKITLKTTKEIIIDKEAVIKDLKMLDGLPPYDEASNICRGDGYFAKSIEKKYGATLQELSKMVGYGAVKNKWETLRRQML